MSEQEKFKKTFEKLHASPDMIAEVLNMDENEKIVSMKKHRLPAVAAAAIALAIFMGTGSVAYAMDLGGIQRIVQVWIHGDQTNATLTIDNVSDENGDYSTYSLEYQDADGKEAVRSGGGTAIEEDGTSRPLTEEEMMEQLNEPEVLCEDNGRIMVYYMDQKLDITDKFVDDYCFVQLKADGKTIYMTVQKDEQEWGSLGCAMSTKSYVQPDEFNTSYDMSDE